MLNKACLYTCTLIFCFYSYQYSTKINKLYDCFLINHRKNNCFSKIQVAGQKHGDKTSLAG